MKHWPLLLAAALFVLDQFTKYLVLQTIPLDVEIEVVPGFFSLVHVANTGAAFGMLRDNNWFFALLATAATVALLFFYFRGSFADAWSRAAFGILLSGVAGNLVDRILHGHVVDFLQFVLPLYGVWPAFNVADSCICVAAGIFIVRSFFEGKPAAK